MENNFGCFLMVRMKNLKFNAQKMFETQKNGYIYSKTERIFAMCQFRRGLSGNIRGVAASMRYKELFQLG
jgi:hypothetical protein